MSTSVSGIGLGNGASNAGTRWIVRAIAAATALLVALIAAAPARADDTVGTVLSATTVGPPPTGYGDTPAPPNSSQPTSTASQSNTATSTQTATATGGAGGSATGGNAGPSEAGGNSHGGDAYANGGSAESRNSLENTQSNQISGRESSGSRFSGGGGYYSDGQDSFVPERTKGRGSDRASARVNQAARSRARFESGTASRGIRVEAKERGGHATGKASPLDGLPGHGGQLPSQNPFFSLLSGSGGAGTGLVLLLLAVLGASIVLPNRRYKTFRAPALPWRPLAYVPPIELPG